MMVSPWRWKSKEVQIKNKTVIENKKVGKATRPLPVMGASVRSSDVRLVVRELVASVCNDMDKVRTELGSEPSHASTSSKWTNRTKT
jgi:hypothetical protein